MNSKQNSSLKISKPRLTLTPKSKSTLTLTRKVSLPDAPKRIYYKIPYAVKSTKKYG